MKCQVDEIDGDAGKSDEVGHGRNTVVAGKGVPVGLVFWILLTEFDVALPVGGKADLSTKPMLLLDLPHHQQVLSDNWSEPLHVQPCHDHSHEEQSHLSWKHNHVLGTNDQEEKWGWRMEGRKKKRKLGDSFIIVRTL